MALTFDLALVGDERLLPRGDELPPTSSSEDLKDTLVTQENKNMSERGSV